MKHLVTAHIPGQPGFDSSQKSNNIHHRASSFSKYLLLQYHSLSPHGYLSERGKMSKFTPTTLNQFEEHKLFTGRWY